MGIEEDYKTFHNEYGLCSDRSENGKGAVTGNDLFWTGFEMSVKRDNLSFLDMFAEGKRALRVLKKYEFLPGLWRRAPSKVDDMQTHDDYYGIGMISSVLDFTIARRWLDFGYMSKHTFLGFITLRYVLNNVNPGKWHKKAWMGRFPHLIAHMKLANTGDIDVIPNKLECSAWTVSMVLSLISIKLAKPGKNIEASTHAWARYWVAEKSGISYYEYCAVIWHKVFLRIKPEGIGGVLASWGPHWKVHPHAKYLKGK